MNKETIERENKEISYAVEYSQFMETESGKTVRLKLLELSKKFRFQDILGIQEDAFADQKGIAYGIELAIRELKDFEDKANKQRKNPETGEKEIFKNKSE